MSDRYDLPRIQPDKPPSYFNREAGGWGSLANFISGVGAIAILSVDVVKGKAMDSAMANKALGIVLGGTAIGTVFGAIKGKARQEREMVEGRVVKDPTIWNSGFWNGALMSIAVTLPTGMLLRAAHVGQNTIGWINNAIWLGAGALGMQARKDDMQRDFDRSVAKRREQIDHLKGKLHTMEQSVKPTQSPLLPSFMNSVNAEETLALAAKQDRPLNHTERSLAEPDAAELAEAKR